MEADLTFTELEATPCQMLYDKNGFNILKAVTTSSDNLPDDVLQHTGKNGRYYIVLKGSNLPDNRSVTMNFTGRWKSGGEYGSAFQVSSYQVAMTNTRGGLIAFLSSKQFPGIGKRLAANIVDKFGASNIIDIIENHPERLAEVKGLSEKKQKSLVAHYNEQRELSRLRAFLKQYNLTNLQIENINKMYGKKAIDIINENPYKLLTVKGVQFPTCDKIALGLNVALNSPIRIESAVVYTLRTLKDGTGDLYSLLPDVTKKSMKILNPDTEHVYVTAAELKAGIKAAYADGQIKVYNIEGECRLMLTTSDTDEHNSVKDLMALVNAKVGKRQQEQVGELIKEFNSSRPIKLSKKQAEAVARSLCNHVAVITGGAGTGKTTIMSCIMYCYEKMYPGKPITLLAPTGKAARRMSESTGYPAHTIHSQLRIYDEMESSVENLPEGLIVIDEFSMVDQSLFAKLMSAVPSTKCNLVMVGDVNQLPSVGAGQCLAQLIKSEVIPVSRLTEIFRQAEDSVIVKNSLKVNAGRTDMEYNECFRIFRTFNEDEALRKIASVYKSEVDKYGIDEVVILCPRRRAGKQGFKVVSAELNGYLQNVINPKYEGQACCTVNNTEFRENDRVMQWKNTATSSNGDIGVLKRIVNDPMNGIEFHIDFADHSVIYTTEDMETFTLAYAMTIHKSQGSEYKSVIIPLLRDQFGPLNKRNLLYTALTRAKQKVTILGDEETITRTIRVADTDSRLSMMSLRLKNASCAR